MTLPPPVPGTTYCSACGARVFGKFCSECGRPTIAPPARSRPDVRASIGLLASRVDWIAVGRVGAAVVIGVALFIVPKLSALAAVGALLYLGVRVKSTTRTGN